MPTWFNLVDGWLKTRFKRIAIHEVVLPNVSNIEIAFTNIA
jgi:hypothetical protein